MMSLLLMEEETEYAGETYTKLALGKRLKCLEEESSLHPSNRRRYFRQHPASTWESESHFNAGQTKDHVLAVVDDSAERAIAFIEKFNTAVTTEEEHTQ